MGKFALFIVAFISWTPLAIWGFIEILVELFYKSRFWKALRKLADVLLIFATLIDISLNVICQVPLNRYFIQARKVKVQNIKKSVTITDNFGNEIKLLDSNNSKFMFIEPYKFGSRKDTMSRVLGIAERDGHLTERGRQLCRLLDIFEEDHCKKSI